MTMSRTGSVSHATFVLAAALAAACGPQHQAEPVLQAQVITTTERKPIVPANTGPTRVEKDLLGEKQVPAAAYYGVQTARALENFQISHIGMGTYPEFVEAFAYVKLAAAKAN